MRADIHIPFKPKDVAAATTNRERAVNAAEQRAVEFGLSASAFKAQGTSLARQVADYERSEKSKENNRYLDELLLGRKTPLPLPASQYEAAVAHEPCGTRIRYRISDMCVRCQQLRTRNASMRAKAS
jgi:hypothetical protein